VSQKYLAPFVFAIAVLGLALSGCKKEEQKAQGAAPAGSGSAVAKPEPKPEPAPAPPPADPNADYVRILASHKTPKPKDPVAIEIKSFKVVKADFDPAKVEGGTAELALDLTSLASDSPKRDNHLRGEDYLKVDEFGTATIKIDNVKKTADNAYSADATVNIHGLEKKLPVAFTVVETLPDGIRIKGEHEFSRHDFAIGAPKGEDDSVGDAQTIQMQLTLKKT
jgi:polyisoprenoid-binding protein YceI